MKLYFSLIVFLFIVHSAFSQTSALKALQSAEALAVKGKYKQAIAVLDKLLSSENSSTAVINKTAYQFALKEYETGFITLNNGIELMPDSVELYMFRGNMLEKARMFKEAIADYTKGYLKSKNDTTAAAFLSNRGGTKANILDYQGGYKDLLLSIKLDSTNVNSYINIAPICNHLGKNEESILFLKKAIALDSLNEGTYVNIGYCYQNMGKHKLAIEAFDKVLQLNPNEPLGYSNRAYSKYKLNDLNGATADINKSLKLFPTNSYAYKIRALIEFAEGKTKTGCEDITKAIELGYITQYGNEVLELQAKYCK
jgi:tetratricopeptide (TPR) repeat protein